MKIFELANILEINVGCNLKWKSYLLALEKKMSSGLFSDGGFKGESRFELLW